MRTIGPAGLALALAVVLVAGAVVVIPRALDRESRVYQLIVRIVGPVRPAPRPVAGVRPPLDGPGAAGSIDTPWTWRNEGMLAHRIAGDSLVMEATTESLWWMNAQGPFLFAPIEGDLTMRAHVKVARRSAPDLPPDREWQFAGIMLRHPGGDRRWTLENYVFIVIGHRGARLQVEFKSTRDAVSDVEAVDWPSGDAELMIERRGSAFTLLARAPGADEWSLRHRFERPDLPATLQAGLILYAFSEGRGVHDLRGTFSAVRLLP